MKANKSVRVRESINQDKEYLMKFMWRRLMTKNG